MAVILHVFNWPFSEVLDNFDTIVKAGYDAILVSPVSFSSESAEWWLRYQPLDFQVVQSPLGNLNELKELCEKVKGTKIKLYADVVINHMAERPDGNLTYPGNDKDRIKKENVLSPTPDNDWSGRAWDDQTGRFTQDLFTKDDFNPPQVLNHKDCANDNHHDTKYHRLNDKRALHGLPDFKYTDNVIARLRSYMQALLDLGFAGFRLDAVKHVELPSLQKIVAGFEDKFIFAEVIRDKSGEFFAEIEDNSDLGMYDFKLFGQIQNAFSVGGSLKQLIDPAGFGNALESGRAVTFTVTHDIVLNETFRGALLSPQDEYLANVYIMGRDGGMPLVYSDHNESLKENEEGMKHPEDEERWTNAFKRRDIKPMIRFHNAVAGLPLAMLYEDDNYMIFRRGDSGIVAINKSNEWVEPDISLYGLKNPSRFNEQLHGYIMNLGGQDSIKLAIAPRSAQMWLEQTLHHSR